MSYEIYGRKDYETPLTLLGTIEAETDKVKAVSLERFGEADWIEMIAVKQEDVITVDLKW